MKVSIITICYNSAETLEATIESVLAQDYDDLEYVVIDGNSSDETMSIVERYRDRIDVIVSEPDKGIYDAMNKGVANCSGDIVGILNSDDFYAYPEVISDIVATFKEGQAEAVYADLVYVDREDTDKVIRKWVSGAYEAGIFKKGWMPPHPAFFTTKEAYNRFGTYRTELKTSADYELMLRLLHKHQLKVAYLPKVITRMRMGGQSNVSIKNRIKANREDRLAWKLNGLNPGALTLIRKPLSKITQFIKR